MSDDSADPPPPAQREADTYTTDLARVRAEFLDFYEHEYRRVVRHMIVYGASLHDAHDAAQEAFTDAWQFLIPSLDWLRITHPRAWIRRVAMRKHIRPAGSRRSAAAVPVAELPDLPNVGMDHIGLTDTTLSLLAAVRKLDENLRAVIAMDWDQVSTLEIAQYLGVTSQRVRDLRKKAREHLRRALETLSGQGGQ